MENLDKKIYRSKDEYIVGGVASGLSSYFKVDTIIVRLIFILLTLWGGSGVLIYLILWLIIPKEPGIGKEIDREEKIQEFASNIKGKASEIAKEMKIDVKKSRKNRNFFLGIVFLLIGVIALWNRFLPIEIRWDILWPVIAIGLGIYIIFKK